MTGEYNVKGDENETMQRLYRFDMLRGRTDNSFTAAYQGSVCYSGYSAHFHLYQRKEAAMKVIVLDRPKILSFFLRRIYGIKKTKDKEV